MIDHPIDLDGRRSADGQRETAMRRRPVNSEPPAASSTEPALGNLEDQMLVEPARNWVELMEKCRFLLLRYASTPEAADERLRKLIERALGDMERLGKREERK